MQFVNFMQSIAGRALRVVLGLVLILMGLFWIEGTAGWIVAVVGMVPLIAGAFRLCLVAPLFGARVR